MDVHSATRDLMLQNQRRTDGHTYTVPSPVSYPYQWLWDSCFHSIILSHIDIALAKAELRSLVAHQRADGCIGHVTYWQPSEVYQITWDDPMVSSITQPPLLAYAVQKIYEADGDQAFLAEMYPHITAFHRYLLTRRYQDHILLSIVNSDESGEDNSPRFDEVMQLTDISDAEAHNQKRFALYDTYRECMYDTNCMAPHFLVEDVPFNTFFVWNTNILAQLADELHQPAAAKEWRSVATQTGQAMRAHMLRDGICTSLISADQTPTNALTWSIFCPLLAGIYTTQEAESLVTTWLRHTTHFAAPHGVPTVAMSDPTFDPIEPDFGLAWQHPHWRGPIWAAVNWFVYQGLTKYGYHADASQLARQTKGLIENEGFREYYHPITGIGMGAHEFTWGGLVVDMK